MPVGFSGRTDNYLGTLPGGSKTRRLAVVYEIVAVLSDSLPKLLHRSENRRLRFLRGEPGKAPGRGKFDIYTETIRKKTERLNKRRGGTGDRFRVNIAVETLCIA